MSRSGKYTVAQFMRDAQEVLDKDIPLEEKQQDIADRLSVLSQRDDLTRFAMPIGPADGSTQNYLLAFEPPFTLLGLSQFDPHYLSPVHEHGDFWVIACGWRGVDRWDMYERKDDGSVPGYADLELVDQIFLPRGATVWMPPPPKSIHSHNNETGGFNYELIFPAAEPMKVEDRLYYDVEERTCWPSLFPPSKIFPDSSWPPHLSGHAQRADLPEVSPASAALSPMAALEQGGALQRASTRESSLRDMFAAAQATVSGLLGRSGCPSCNLIDLAARANLKIA